MRRIFSFEGRKSKPDILIILLCMICLLSCDCTYKENGMQLKQKAIEKEVAFQALVDHFNSVIPKGNYIITFGVGSWGRVHLHYYINEGNIADRAKYFGDNDLRLHSAELDKLIKDLGWTYETIDKLTKELKEIKCDYIRNTDWYCKPVNIYNTPADL